MRHEAHVRTDRQSSIGWGIAILGGFFTLAGACGSETNVMQPIGTTAGTSAAPVAGTAAAPPATGGVAGTGSVSAQVPATAGTSAPVTPATGAAGTAAAATAGTGAKAPTAGTGAAAMAGTGAAAMAGTGAAAMAGTGATAGTGAAPAGGVALQDCMSDGSTAPCGTFTPLHGAKIQLGPLGGQMDKNVGKGFENAVSAQDSSPTGCDGFAAIFAQDPEDTKVLLDTKDLDFKLYTVYRPANWEPGKKYPVITWGNGTCAMPEGYGALLRYVASHGFVIFATNSRSVGDIAINPKPMVRALDFAFAAAKDPMSPYYDKLDLEHVGAMGHSQGGAATISAATDPRVSGVILFNGGPSASKPFMTVSGERDIPGIGAGSAADLRGPVMSAPKQAAFLFYHMIPMTGSFDGHLTLMTQPERVVDATTQWWKALWNLDPAAKDWFVGPNCKLCGMNAQFEFGQKGLE